MGRSPHIALFLVLLAAASANADVVRGTHDSGPGSASAAAVLADRSCAGASVVPAPGAPQFGLALPQPRYAVVDSSQGAAGSSVRVLPPAPSSFLLVASALASLGAYQGLRSINRLHLGTLPDWYHAGAVQVGHATPLSLEFDLSALPACVFDAPPAERPIVLRQLPREPRSRLLAQCTSLIASPRGPPA